MRPGGFPHCRGQAGRSYLLSSTPSGPVGSHSVPTVRLFPSGNLYEELENGEPPSHRNSTFEIMTEWVVLLPRSMKCAEESDGVYVDAGPRSWPRFSYCIPQGALRKSRWMPEIVWAPKEPRTKQRPEIGIMSGSSSCNYANLRTF